MRCHIFSRREWSYGPFLNSYIVSLSWSLLVGLLTSNIFADGGFFWRKGADLHEPSQTALIYHVDGIEKLILQVKYEGPADDFAWIVPLPSVPEIEAIPMDKSPFPELSLYTQARYYVSQEFGLGYGGSGKSPAVTVLQRKIVGIYDTAILDAQDPNALLMWLNKNGYAFPSQRLDVLKHYVEKHWKYVALRINAKAVKSKEIKTFHTGQLQPVRFTFKTDQAVYPLKISSVNAGITEILLYVLAEEPLILEHYRYHLEERSIEKNFPPTLSKNFRDPASGMYPKINGKILPRTWRALNLPQSQELSLCKYRSIMKTREMNDDFIFGPFDTLKYWQEKFEHHDYMQKHYRSLIAEKKPHVLTQCVRDPDSEMRALIAANPRTTTKYLTQLAHDPDPNVLEYLARNLSTPANVLKKLAGMNHLNIQSYVSMNPNSNVETLNTLLQHAKQDVYAVTSNVIHHKNVTPEILAQLALDPYEIIRDYVAENPRTPKESLRKLTQDESEWVRGTAHGNPNTPVDLLRQASTSKEYLILSAIAANKNTPPDILRLLAKQDDADIIDEIASNPACPEELLKRWAQDKDTGLRKSVAWNEKAPIPVIQTLARDKSVSVRISIAGNPQTPESILRDLMNDQNKGIALSAALNLYSRLHKEIAD